MGKTAEPYVRMTRAPLASAVKWGLAAMLFGSGTAAAQTTTWMLEGRGHDLRFACNAADALKVASDFEPDAILLDIGMPGMNGYDLCRELRAKSGTLPIIFLTASTGSRRHAPSRWHRTPAPPR